MSKPIRIVQILNFMVLGGAETMIMNIYRKLDKSKFQFDFIVHTENEEAYDQEISSLGGLIFRLPKYSPLSHNAYKKAWSDWLKDHPEYKVFHAHLRTTASIFTPIIHQFGGKVMVHSHSTSSEKGLKGIYKNFLLRPIKHQADYFIGCSLNASKWLFGDQVTTQDNHSIINNGIDLSRFKYDLELRNKARQELQLKDEKVYGLVARFFEPKNHSYLIDVFHDLVATEPNIKLLLVGDGPLKEGIKKEIQDAGLTDFVILRESSKDVEKYYNAMDVFVMPSLYEGIPLTLIEAQMNGLPIIASDKIDPEVNITKTIHFTSIKTLDSFKDAMRTITGTRHEVDINVFIEHGYDVFSNMKKIERIYLDLWNQTI